MYNQEGLIEGRTVSVYDGAKGKPFANQNEELRFSKQYINKIMNNHQGNYKSPTFYNSQTMFNSDNKGTTSQIKQREIKQNNLTQQQIFKNSRGDGDFIKQSKQTNEKKWVPGRKVIEDKIKTWKNQNDQDVIQQVKSQMKSQMRNTQQNHYQQRNPIINEKEQIQEKQEKIEKKNFLKKNQSMMNFQSNVRYEKGSIQNLEYDVFPKHRENLKKRVEGLKSGIDLAFSEQLNRTQNRTDREKQEKSCTIKKTKKDKIMDKMNGKQISNIMSYSYAPAFREQPVTQKCQNINMNNQLFNQQNQGEASFKRIAFLEKKQIYQQ